MHELINNADDSDVLPFMLDFTSSLPEPGQASFMHIFAKESFKRVEPLLTGTVFKPPVMTYGTMCSGTDIPALAVQEACTHMSDLLEKKLGERVEVQMRQVFLCELDDDKRAFAMGLTGGDAASACCAFKDVQHISGEWAWCYRHKQECLVPRADGAWLLQRGAGVQREGTAGEYRVS